MEEHHKSSTNASGVACPVCAAPANWPCMEWSEEPRRGRFRKTHVARLMAAELAADATIAPVYEQLALFGNDRREDVERLCTCGHGESKHARAWQRFGCVVVDVVSNKAVRCECADFEASVSTVRL